jgi:hypothetical protein
VRAAIEKLILAGLGVLVTLGNRLAKDRAFVVLALPIAQPSLGSAQQPESAAHASCKTVALDASSDVIAAAIDGMRCLNPTEQSIVPVGGALKFVCCDCGLCHSISYQPAVTAERLLCLVTTTDTDQELTAKVRKSYEFPFAKRPPRRRGLTGMINSTTIRGDECRR